MSNPVPNLLALTSIADGSKRLAAPIRNNYSAIQVAVNALITVLSGGLVGQRLEAADTSDVRWTYPPGYEFGYEQKTTDTAVTATSAATANVVATTEPATYDGSTVVMIEIACFASVQGTTWIRGVIYMDGALLQDIVFYNTHMASPSSGKFRYTPPAGAHTFGFATYVDAGTGTIDASGGAPAFIRVTKAT